MVSDICRYPMNTRAGLEVNTLADGLFIWRLGFLSWQLP
jgi:hypothetical protein